MTTLKYTPHQIQEFVRCADPKYFISTYCKINHPSRGLIPFALYDHQRETLDAYVEYNYTVVDHSRQTGDSVVTAAYLLWYVMFNDNKSVMVLNSKDAIAVEFMQRIRTMYEHLPAWLKWTTAYNNKHDIQFDNNSRIISRHASCCATRGMALNLLVLHDCEWVRNDTMQETLDAAYPCIACDRSKVIVTGAHNPTATALTDFKSMLLSNPNSKHRIITWDMVPGRNQEFKDRMIAVIGEEAWKREYGHGKA